MVALEAMAAPPTERAVAWAAVLSQAVAVTGEAAGNVDAAAGAAVTAGDVRPAGHVVVAAGAAAEVAASLGKTMAGAGRAGSWVAKVIWLGGEGSAWGWGRVAGTGGMAGGWVVATGEEAKTWRRVGVTGAGASENL